MRPIEFMRGIGFRIAALTTVLVFVSMVALGVALYAFINDALEGLVVVRIERELGRLLALGTSARPQPLIAEIERRTQADVARRFAYRVLDTEGEGRHVVGDPWITPGKPGWSKQHVPDQVETKLSRGHMLVLTTPINASLTLSIGRDVEWISDVEDEMIGLLRWAFLGGLALAALTAYLVARVVAHRIDVVATSAVSIMDGNLKHRIPLTGARDDFDRLSATLNEMLDRIQGLISNVEQVTNDIAHDLRTPLGRLRQGLEMARSQALTTDTYERAVDRAIAEADGLLATFTALLRIAQIEAGASRAAFRQVDLSEIARSVAETYELDAEEGGHHLESAITNGVHIAGDRDLLVQLFANLIENALTHTPSGTTITVSLDTTESALFASVTDDGPGVPAAERDKIFQRFHRLEASRTTPGTGLGLSLVAAVAKLHGARIEVGDNHPGLRIDLTFPVNAAS